MSSFCCILGPVDHKQASRPTKTQISNGGTQDHGTLIEQSLNYYIIEQSLNYYIIEHSVETWKLALPWNLPKPVWKCIVGWKAVTGAYFKGCSNLLRLAIFSSTAAMWWHINYFKVGNHNLTIGDVALVWHLHFILSPLKLYELILEIATCLSG